MRFDKWWITDNFTHLDSVPNFRMWGYIFESQPCQSLLLVQEWEQLSMINEGQAVVLTWNPVQSKDRHFMHGATSCKVNLWNWDLMCDLLWGLDLCCVAQSIWTGGSFRSVSIQTLKMTWSVECRGVGVGGERQEPIFAPVRSGSPYQKSTVHLFLRSCWYWKHLPGLPWWLVAKTPCFQWREHGFHPWSGN